MSKLALLWCQLWLFGESSELGNVHFRHNHATTTKVKKEAKVSVSRQPAQTKSADDQIAADKL